MNRLVEALQRFQRTQAALAEGGSSRRYGRSSRADPDDPHAQMRHQAARARVGKSTDLKKSPYPPKVLLDALAMGKGKIKPPKGLDAVFTQLKELMKGYSRETKKLPWGKISRSAGDERHAFEEIEIDVDGHGSLRRYTGNYYTGDYSFFVTRSFKDKKSFPKELEPLALLIRKGKGKVKPSKAERSAFDKAADTKSPSWGSVGKKSGAQDRNPYSQITVHIDGVGTIEKFTDNYWQPTWTYTVTQRLQEGLGEEVTMFKRTKLPSWHQDAIKIHEGYSTSYPQAHGHNRYQKKGMGAEVRSALLDQRKGEILAFAEDQGIDPNIVFGVCEAAMRIGKVPEMGMYGLGENDSWALAHFLADAILNTAHEDEQQQNADVVEINEAISAGSAVRAEVPYSLAGEFADMARTARGVSKVMPHGMARGKTATLYVLFRNSRDAKGQAGDRIREMALSMGGKIMEGKTKKVKAVLRKHKETGKIPKKAAHDTELELSLNPGSVKEARKPMSYEAWVTENPMDEHAECPGCVAEAEEAKTSQRVEEEFINNPPSMSGSSKPSQYGFASPFPWSESSRGRGFNKPAPVVEEKKPKRSFGVGPGSQGNQFFRT